MPVHNQDIANMLDEMADLLEIDGADRFRVRAYRNAASTIASLGHSVAQMVERGEKLSKLPGIGKALEKKIVEMVETGGLTQLKSLEERVPPELAELMHSISGLGSKKMRALHTKLGIDTARELKEAAEKGKIRDLAGFGEKTERSILEQLKKPSEHEKRLRLNEAEEIADSLVDYLGGAEGVGEVVVAGSYRRRKETVGDLDILVTCAKSSRVMERFLAYEDVEKVVSKGETRSSAVLRSGFQVDVRVMEQKSFGAALVYFTGSKAHNVAIRKLAIEKGLKINEYGVFRGDRLVAGKTEEEVYESLGLTFMEPELRENRGEIEASIEGSLPSLVTLDDVRGDLHVHTKETDGRNTIREMAEAAARRGYEYIAVADHTKRVAIARGMDEEHLKRQVEEIDRLNGELDDILVLKAAEVDILEDGSLDLADDVLEMLDITVCAVHYGFNFSSERQTERIIRAMDNPNFNIMAHPTGRLLGERKAYEVDMERLFDAALERGCHFELNAFPDRLDLRDIHLRMAKEMGLKVAISTDAHKTMDLGFMRFGVAQAKRGWLEKEDVLNTRSLGELMGLIKR